MTEFTTDDAGKTIKEENMVSQSIRVLCPFIGKPFESCYCASTSSLYTEATIHYCGGNFKSCEIYEKNVGSGGLMS
jgi:hypothetical protein